MDGVFAFHGVADIHGAVVVALGAERAQSLGREQLARAEVEHFLALTAVERRILESDGDGHVGTHLKVGVRAVDVVVEIAEIVEESRYERCLRLLGQLAQRVGVFAVASCLLKHRDEEHQGVVPQGVEFEYVAGARYYGSTLDRGREPGDRFVGAVGAHQAVRVEAQIGDAALAHAFHQILHRVEIAGGAPGAVGVAAVLLYRPDGPEGNVRQVNLLDDAVGGAGFDVAAQGVYGRLENRVVVLLMVDGQRAAGQRYQFVAAADVIPGIARHDVHAVLVLEIELFGGVLEAVEEARAARARLKLGFVGLLERRGVCFESGGREDHRLTLLDRELEISGHP